MCNFVCVNGHFYVSLNNAYITLVLYGVLKQLLDTIFVVHPQYLLRHKDGGKFCESLRANPVRLTNMLSGQLQVQVSIKISASWKQLKPIHQQYLIHPLTKSDSK